MNRTLNILLTGGLLAAIAVPIATFAGPHRGPGVEQRLEKMTELVDLTPAQQEQIRAITEANKAEAEAVRTELRTSQKALAEAIEGGADNDTIAGLAIAAHEQRQEAREQRQDVRKEIGAVLTPEQKEILKAKRMEHRGERGDFEGRRGKRGGL
jgi:Spy/CpxP family protein refolding chaperone